MTTKKPLPPDHILWIDPGVTTGWALYYVKDDHLVQEQYDFQTFIRRIEAWMSTAGKSTLLGVERFVITPDTARRPGSIDAIQAWGVARAAYLRHQGWRFVENQTSSAMGFCPDDVLRAVGWYRTTMGHANDATRHLVHWMAQENRLTPALSATLMARTEQEGSGQVHGRHRSTPA